MNRGRRPSTIAVGIVFGFLVTGSGFGNYTTIHQALLLRSWRPVGLVFIAVVVTLSAASSAPPAAGAGPGRARPPGKPDRAAP
jgi:hypothetical protein